MYVSYGGPLVLFACGVATNLTVNRDTVRAVSELENKVGIGALHFGEQMNDGVCLLLTVRLHPRWLQSADFSAKQILIDVLSNLPTMARDCGTTLLDSGVGGNLWIDDDDDAWPLIVAGHL